MNTWRVRSSVRFSAGQFVEHRLENIGAVARWVMHVARIGMLMWKMDSQDKKRFHQYLRLHDHHDTTTKNPRCVDQVCARQHRGSEHCGLKSAELLDARHGRLLFSPAKSHTRERNTFQDAREEIRRTATAQDVNRGVQVEQDTRPLEPNSSSMDPDPKRLKPAAMADLMDGDTFQNT